MSHNRIKNLVKHRPIVEFFEVRASSVRRPPRMSFDASMVSFFFWQRPTHTTIFKYNLLFCCCFVVVGVDFSPYFVQEPVCSQHKKRWVLHDYLFFKTATHARAHVHFQHNTAQHSTTQHNTAQHNTTQHNTAQHSTTQHNTT